MSEHPCDLQIHINAQHTFFLSQKTLCRYSAKLRRIVAAEKQRAQIRVSGIEIPGFPGGPEGFEMVARFCYGGGGGVPITVANVSLLRCCAAFLEMDETAASRANLLHQTECFLEGIFYWSWDEILSGLKSCEPFLPSAVACGLLDRLLCAILAKIAQKSDANFLSTTSYSSSSSPETGCRGFGSPSGVCLNSSSRKPQLWWFQELAILCPKIIEHLLKSLGAYGSDNNNLVLTRFLLHYLKTTLQSRNRGAAEYGCLADTAVHGVESIGRVGFSCRALLWVLRIVSGFGLSRERRAALERLIGGVLDQATLDDLLVSGGGNGGVYDVSLVLRLIRLFVHCSEKTSLEKMRKVGRLMDMYLREIGPDPSLKLSKFVGVAESLPDCARESFDRVYRAIDIYLESHPTLSLEERSRLCRCLNYAKLSLEACKDLAKNPRIPPRIAVQALASQHSSLQTLECLNSDGSGMSRSKNDGCGSSSNNSNDYQLVVYKRNDDNDDDRNVERLPEADEKEALKLNLERMQWRVVELEKVCREMKGQMARMVKLAPQHSRQLPRLC